MAELTHFYDEENAVGVLTTTGSWLNAMDSGSNPAQILGSALTANTKYLIVARALVGGTDVNVLGQLRVQTDDDSTIETKSEAIIEFERNFSTAKLAYLFVHSFTTDGTPADVEIQGFASTNQSLRIDQSSLFLLDLDAIGTEGTDYYEDIQAVSGDEYSTTAATTVLASLSGADLGTDEHLILGSARCDIGSGGRWFNHSLHAAYDSSTAAERSLHQAEGEDTDEQRLVGFAIRHKASSGTPNVTLYGTEEATNANALDGGAYLIALPASLFADFVDDYEAGAVVIDGTETTIATTGSYTPTVTGNHLVIGRSNGATAIAPPDQLGAMWVESTTTEIRTGDSTSSHNQIWDATKDLEQQVTFQRYSITTAETFNLRSEGAAADFDQEHRWLIVVNLNPPAGGGATANLTTITAQATIDAPTTTTSASLTTTAVLAQVTIDQPVATGGVTANLTTFTAQATLTTVTTTTSASLTTTAFVAQATLTTVTTTTSASLTTTAFVAQVTVDTVAVTVSLPGGIIIENA